MLAEEYYNEKSAENALYPLWQDIQGDYLTHCGLIIFPDEARASWYR
jgi:hypothetical protein